jgi:hypothetical protein
MAAGLTDKLWNWEDVFARWMQQTRQRSAGRIRKRLLERGAFKLGSSRYAARFFLLGRRGAQTFRPAIGKNALLLLIRKGVKKAS